MQLVMLQTGVDNTKFRSIRKMFVYVKTIKHFEYSSKMAVQEYRADKLNMLVSCCEANAFLMK